MANHEYIGDAVYVFFDGFQIVLYTHDGMRETNRICLNPEVLQSLDRYVAALSVRPAPDVAQDSDHLLDHRNVKQ